MTLSELDKLRTLAEFAKQISTTSETDSDARQQIGRLIEAAEDDIKAKTLDIQLQKSHIALLKQLEGFMGNVVEPGHFRLSGVDGGGQKSAPAAQKAAAADR